VAKGPPLPATIAIDLHTKGISMPTHVVFHRGEDLTFEEDFDQVTRQLLENAAGVFNRSISEGRHRRTTVFRENVQYIEDYEGVETYKQ
jgi:hypothetical protein